DRGRGGARDPRRRPGRGRHTVGVPPIRVHTVRRVLVVRLDSDGDVLLAGPAVRAVAAGADEVVMVVGPRGQQAAGLLPGVDAVEVWRCPWVDGEPPPVTR